MYYGRFCEYLHGDDGLACFSYLTFCANCADSAELVPAVVDVHVDCFLFDPSLKRCDANCDGLASLELVATCTALLLLDVTRKLLLMKLV